MPDNILNNRSTGGPPPRKPSANLTLIKRILRAFSARLRAVEAFEIPAGPPGSDGRPGADGRGIASLRVNADGILFAEFSDGAVELIDMVVGAPGSTGAQGKIGPVGRPGDDGAVGVAGEPGEPGATGGQGKIGPVGRPGDDGAAGKDGKDGRDGRDGLHMVAARIDDDDRKILIVNLSNATEIRIDAVSLVGPPGKQGEKGNAGRRGAEGLTGDKGATGLTGYAGATGATGDQGDQGPPAPSFRFTDSGRANLRAEDLGKLRFSDFYVGDEFVARLLSVEL